jgi:hypothetical protein
MWSGESNPGWVPESEVVSGNFANLADYVNTKLLKTDIFSGLTHAKSL